MRLGKWIVNAFGLEEDQLLLQGIDLVPGKHEELGTGFFAFLEVLLGEVQEVHTQQWLIGVRLSGPNAEKDGCNRFKSLNRVVHLLC